MNVERKLKSWVDAQVIDQPQAEKILHYEREHGSNSWVLYGLCGLGVVVLLAGFISVIAANWFTISPIAKLVIYFISLIALAWGAARYGKKPGALRESLLTAFVLYVLAGIALIGQTYNLEGENFTALLFWLALITPAVLISQSRLPNAVWFGGVVATALVWAFSTSGYEDFRMLCVMSLPYFFLGLGYGATRFLPEKFCDAARFWSYVTIFIPFAIMGSIGWAAGSFFSGEYRAVVWPPAVWIGIVVALIGAVLRKIQPGLLTTIAICVAILASAELVFPTFSYNVHSQPMAGCFFFLLLWSAGAVIAAANERKRLFDFAAFVIGLRFVVIYFEVFGSLAATGFGLILSGLVILGIAYLWHRFRRTIAATIREAA